MLPFDDKVSPEIIQREFSLSKNAFKRAVGHLLKEGRIGDQRQKDLSEMKNIPAGQIVKRLQGDRKTEWKTGCAAMRHSPFEIYPAPARWRSAVRFLIFF